LNLFAALYAWLPPSFPDRIKFVERTGDLGSYHRRLCACDLFLDTPFYNAGSTSPTVLWAGVPLLTLAGNRTASRLAAGLLLLGGHAGTDASTKRHPDKDLGRLLVARTYDEYERLMVCARAYVWGDEYQIPGGV
jgi:hypothetical protein